MSTSISHTAAQQLQRVTALEYILLGDLRDLLDDSPGPQTSKWLLAVLDALLETLPEEFDLEEQGGYLTDVAETNPTWSNQIDELQKEHGRLYVSLKNMRDRILAAAPFEVIADAVRNDLQQWMLALNAHNRHENRLIQASVNLEIGVGD